MYKKLLKNKQKNSLVQYSLYNLQIKSIFSQNLKNDLIRLYLKKIAKLKDIIKKDDLITNQNVEKLIILRNMNYLLSFKRYTGRIFIIRKC